MCCLLIVILGIGIALFAFYVAGIIIAINVVLLILFLASLFAYSKVSGIMPTAKKCSKCDSEDIIIQSIQTGTKTESKTYGNTISSITHPITKQVAICQKCGNSWDYISADEVFAQKKAARTRIALFGVLFAISLVFSFWIFGGNNNDGNEDEELKTEANATVIEETTIDDFSYDLDSTRVVLDEYNGNAELLEIESEYYINGRSYLTDLSDFQVGARSVNTLILDEGILNINTSIFNGSNVENIYFPKSIELVYDYTLSYLHPDEEEKVKVYYAGTEEEWNQIFTEYQRTNVSDAELGEELGTALADKANEMLGVEYDESQFEFIFEASPNEKSGD